MIGCVSLVACALVARFRVVVLFGDCSLTCAGWLLVVFVCCGLVGRLLIVGCLSNVCCLSFVGWLCVAYCSLVVGLSCVVCCVIAYCLCNCRLTNCCLLVGQSL